MAKKFLNNNETIVDDALKGLVLSNSGIKFHPNCDRVCLRSDIEIYSKQKVSLIAGGGSGHEPYASGYIGEGLLTAAVAGNVFASPPSRNVLFALNATKSDVGSIIFIINYTGDRLNFGLAAEKFQGIVKVIIINDDMAIDNVNSKVGRRGLAGAVLAIKIAGAMAEQNKSIDNIYQFVKNVVENMGTFGVSLYSCSLPGKNRESNITEEEIEIGLGIHGEPGRTKAKYTTAREIIKHILESLKTKIEMKNGENFVVLINNLGSVSQIEMNIINGETISWFKDNNMIIKRFFSGIYMTSLNGYGISITVLKLNRSCEEIINYLDFPTKAPGWVPATKINEFNVSTSLNSTIIPQSNDILKIEACGGFTDPIITKQCLLAICEAAQTNENLLNNLDAVAGDGDCGSTFASAAKSIYDSIEDLSTSRLKTLFQQLSIIFEQSVGGTSGALYALMLSSAATCFDKDTDSNICQQALEKSNKSIQEYGGARPGDRTMVDALSAAVEILKNDSSKNKWENAIKASEEAAALTTHQHATLGRASYTSVESQTQPDAGATAMSIWLRTLWNVVQKNQ